MPAQSGHCVVRRWNKIRHAPRYGAQLASPVLELFNDGQSSNQSWLSIPLICTQLRVWPYGAAGSRRFNHRDYMQVDHSTRLALDIAIPKLVDFPYWTRWDTTRSHEPNQPWWFTAATGGQRAFGWSLHAAHRLWSLGSLLRQLAANGWVLVG